MLALAAPTSALTLLARVALLPIPFLRSAALSSIAPRLSALLAVRLFVPSFLPLACLPLPACFTPCDHPLPLFLYSIPLTFAL